MGGAGKSELAFLSAVQARALMERRELSSFDLIVDVASQYQHVNPRIRALTADRLDEAAEDAKRLDDRLARDGLVGPLHGLPFTVKDVTETAKLPTTYGSRAYQGHYSGFNATAVARLEAAGGILIAKSNTPEFSLRPTTESKLFGATLNPWNRERSPGGSSGGAAAAVAAGLAPLALGSDGGGSCRIPASCCGVVGLKPTRGRVPWGPALWEHWAGLGSEGPITRTVRDAALMLDVISGPALGEPYSLPASVSFMHACDTQLLPQRLAYTLVPPHGKTEEEVVQAFLASLQAFADMGHHLEEVQVDFSGLSDAFMTIVACNTAAQVSAVPNGRLSELESSTIELAMHGYAIGVAEYCKAIQVGHREAARITKFLNAYDFVLTPTLTSVPPKVGHMPSRDDFDSRWQEYLDWMAFCYPVNFTGQPAISLPSGWSKATDTPIGLQIIGKHAGETEILALAAAYEESRPWNDARLLLP